MLKLNQRLDAIFHCIPQGYDDIWDCCCDHGYLGMKILQAQLCQTVLFVDQVASITSSLSHKLEQYGAGNYKVLTASAATLLADSNKRHLMILAGISGNTVIDIMQGLHSLNPGLAIDFIVSPNYQIVEVRHYLVQRGFRLRKEALVCDNRQDYEVIYVCAGNEPTADKLTPYGSIWDMQNSQHQQYLQKLVFNYTHKNKNSAEKYIAEALETYRCLLAGKNCPTSTDLQTN